MSKYPCMLSSQSIRNANFLFIRYFWLGLVGLILFLCLAGCSSDRTETPVEVIPSPCPTYPPSTSLPAFSATASTEPSQTPEPRTLTICLGAEPDTLFIYNSSMLVANSVRQAIYDGPIDRLSYGFQPGILEKLPSLEDGDARIQSVSVQPGDEVVDNNGDVVKLVEGQFVKPYGCNRNACAVIFDGEVLEMSQLTADFTLLAGLHWSDGESLTAEDAVFGYEIAQHCDEYAGDLCPYNSLVERTADFIAIDQRTARWSGLPGFMDPHYMTNFFHPLPKHQLSNIPIEQMAEAEETASRPMGWGPYMIEKWDVDKEIRLRKNPYYFRAAEGLPRFDRLIFKFTGESSLQNIAKILAGECDLVDQDAGLEDVLKLLLGLDQQRLLQAHVVEGGAWEHFDFSLLHADYDDGYQIGSDRPDLFGDVRTRQAIAMCLDRERVLNEAVYEMSEHEQPYLDPGHPLYDMVFGIGEAPNAYVPKNHPLYNPEVQVYQYNPDKANGLLEQVGWIDHDDDTSTPRIANSVPNVPDGTPLTFNYWTTSSSQRKQVAAILTESLAKCGIKVDISFWDVADFFELPNSPVFTRKFDVVEFAWFTGELPPCGLFLSENIPGDPEAYNPDGSQRFPKGWEGENNSGYKSAEFDLACNAALAALPGQPGFAENHLLAQEIFARDLPIVPLFQRLKVTAARADMCGYWMDSTADSDTWNIEEFGYGDECGE
jgi:peptide/nickel transport system substrate-binding protein